MRRTVGDMAGESTLVEKIVLIVLFVVSTAANSLALCVYTKRPGLRTKSNRFVMNLLGTNLITTALLASSLIAENTVKTESGKRCWSAISDSAAVACSLAALLAVLLISIDQHHAVTDPLRCHARLMQRRPNILLAAAWIVAMAAGIIKACFSITSYITDSKSQLRVYDAVFAGAYLVAGVMLPSFVVSVMYVRIYKAAKSSGLKARAHDASMLQLQDSQPPLPDLVEEEEGLTLKIDDSKRDSDVEKGNCAGFLIPQSEKPRRYPSVASLKQTKKESRSNEDVRGMTTVGSAPALPGLANGSRPTSASRVAFVKCRISNASLFRYREESRAARIGISTGVIVLLHLPHAVLAFLTALGCETTIPARAPFIALLVLAACLSPFLFAFRSRHVQREAKRLFLPDKSFSRSSIAAPSESQARVALDLLRTLQQRSDNSNDTSTKANNAGRGSFSSGGSTQVSTASEE